MQPNLNDLSGHDLHPFLKCAFSFCPVQLRRTSSWLPMGSPCTCYLRRTVSSMQNMLEFTRTWLIHFQTILSHPLIIPTSLRTSWPGTVAPSHISGKSCLCVTNSLFDVGWWCSKLSWCSSTGFPCQTDQAADWEEGWLFSLLYRPHKESMLDISCRSCICGLLLVATALSQSLRSFCLWDRFGCLFK